MRLLTATMLFLFSVLVLAALSVPASRAADNATDPEQQLFEAKCQKCHSLDKVKEAHLTLDRVRPTVDRMKSKPGSDITQKDADSLYEFLSTYFVIPPPPPGVPAPPAK
jgi:cytochrome c2